MNTGAKERPISQILAAEAYERNKERKKVRAKDFDHIKDIPALKSTLLHDPYFTTELMFTSPSGDGIKWWVPIDIQKRPHEVWFKAMQNYLNATYGLEADPQCVNVSRACFLPYDPNCYVNPNICPY